MRTTWSSRGRRALALAAAAACLAPGPAAAQGLYQPLSPVARRRRASQDHDATALALLANDPGLKRRETEVWRIFVSPAESYRLRSDAGVMLGRWPESAVTLIRALQTNDPVQRELTLRAFAARPDPAFLRPLFLAMLADNVYRDGVTLDWPHVLTNFWAPQILLRYPREVVNAELAGVMGPEGLDQVVDALLANHRRQPYRDDLSPPWGLRPPDYDRWRAEAMDAYYRGRLEVARDYTVEGEAWAPGNTAYTNLWIGVPAMAHVLAAHVFFALLADEREEIRAYAQTVFEEDPRLEQAVKDVARMLEDSGHAPQPTELQRRALAGELRRASGRRPLRVDPPLPGFYRVVAYPPPIREMKLGPAWEAAREALALVLLSAAGATLAGLAYAAARRRRPEALVSLRGVVYAAVFLPIPAAVANLWLQHTEPPPRDPILTVRKVAKGDDVFSNRDYTNSIRWNEFAVDKREGVFRVLFLGASSVYGYPLDADSPFSARTAALLEERRFARRVEPINLAQSGYGSDLAARRTEESYYYRPDAIVVYIGHNDQIITYHREEGVGAALARERLRDFALFRTLEGGIARLREGDDAPPSPRPPRYESGVTTASERSRRFALGRAVAEHNLRRVASAAGDYGIPVVFIPGCSNLADAPPAGSRSFLLRKEGDLARWRAEVEGGRALLREGRAEEAAARLAEVVRADPTQAEGRFAYGQALLTLGRAAEARAEFEAARDWDAEPVRATSETRAFLARTAAELGLTVLNPDCALDRASRRGVPGFDLFLDHVHFNPAGHEVIAQTLADYFEKGVTDTCAAPGARAPNLAN